MSELVSTRDPEANKISYTEALLRNYAPDGGLYLPTAYPRVTTAELRRLADRPYEEIFLDIKSRLIGDSIPPAEQSLIAAEAYNLESFPNSIDGNTVPIQKIGENLYVQCLYGGPTAAFKDLGMRSLAGDIGHILSRESEGLTILGATSGDTGAAAQDAFKTIPEVRVIILSPETGMSKFQKAHMGALAVENGNIFNVSVPDNFDRCRDMVKELEEDPRFAGLGAVNSVNWGRVVGQIPYYFAGYFQVAEYIGQEVDFVVPTGNFGNVLSGHIARSMGLPIRELIIATNENDTIHHLVQTGVYNIRRKAEITNAPSMDIDRAVNIERKLYEIFQGNTAAVRSYMDQLKRTGQVSFEDFGLSPSKLKREGFDSGTSTNKQRVDIIGRVYKDSGFIIDPHTASGAALVYDKSRLGELEVPTVILATASPVKFEGVVAQAIGAEAVPKREDRFKDIEERGSKAGSFVLIREVEVLKAYIRSVGWVDSLS
jgi:threonine synthase